MQASQNGDVGMFGEVGGASSSNHVDYDRSNVSVGPDLGTFTGGKNVFLGVRAGDEAKGATENVVAGWYAGGAMGRSNVVAGSRAAQFVQRETAYSVILGALAGYTAKVATNSVLIGSRAAEGVESMVDTVVAGVNTKALNDLIQSVVVGVDSTIGGYFGEVSERVTALVNGSWIGGRDVVAVGNGIVTQDRSTGVVALGNNINAGAGDNLIVGMDLSVDIGTAGAEIFGRGTRIVGRHQNVLAVGAGQREINRSDAEYIGSGIFYDRITDELSLADGALTASADFVSIGGMIQVFRDDKVQIKNIELKGAVLKGGLTITEGEGRWRIALEQASGDEYDLVFTSGKGTRVVFHDHYETGATNFTGQHRCVTTELRLRAGMVLVATGEYCDLQGYGVSIDEAIPVVEVCRRPADPTVFGVVSRVEDAAGLRRMQVGHIGFDLANEDNKVRVVVNSSGEGGIWVCDEGGPCRNGDLLCSSSRPGYSMKQAGPDIVTSCTCGKLTSDCTFGVNGTCFTGCVYKF